MSEIKAVGKKEFDGSIWEIWIDDLCGELAMNRNANARRKVEVVEKEDYDKLEQKCAELTEALQKAVDDYWFKTELRDELNEVLEKYGK